MIAGLAEGITPKLSRATKWHRLERIVRPRQTTQPDEGVWARHQCPAAGLSVGEGVSGTFRCCGRALKLSMSEKISHGSQGARRKVRVNFPVEIGREHVRNPATNEHLESQI